MTIEYLSTQSCFFNVVFSDNDGDSININVGPCIENIPCDDLDFDNICDNVDDCVGEFDECGVCGGNGIDQDEDGICDDVDPCVGEYDECGVCNGDGIADDECDCDGNILDECGVCGGSGIDEDEDGICDDVDPCVGEYDECGECNGDGSSCLDNQFNYMPDKFFLSNAYPNPFNPQTSFNYEVPYYSKVNIKIYNSNGKIVSIPVNEFHVPGFYSFVWNPMSLSSGVYYIQLISDQIRISKKVVYLK